MKASFFLCSLSVDPRLTFNEISAGRATGDAAYRIIIPREKLEDDPELLQLVTEKVGIRWMGPG